MLGRWFSLFITWANCWLKKVCGKTEFVDGKKSSKKVEVEGLRTRRKKGRESETRKKNSLLRVIGRNQPLNQDKNPLSAALSGERTQENDHC